MEPVEYILGQNVRGEDETMQYIPVLLTINSLLSKDDVFAEVYNGHFSDETLEDYCDGSLFASNDLFSRNHMNLQIQLYFDDFCVANPLGNKVKQLKFGAFYYVLGNISPKYRCKLQSIQLAGLCMSSHIKKYGMHRILQPLLRDITVLETDGLTLHKDGVEHNIHGTVSFISADNLGAHTIGGFQEHFHHGRVCRVCNVTSQTLKNHFSSQGLEIRSKEAYDQQAQLVQDNPNLALLYGVKRKCTFNQLQYFHITSGLPGDVAHDLFEGIVPEVICNTIKYCVSQGFFSLQYFNHQVSTFAYDASDKRNKPSVMSSEIGSFKVKQTAAQSWCLVRLLPLMVGHAIPFGDAKWVIFLLLLDVVEHCMMPKVDRGTSEFLAYLIELFLTGYYTEYTEITMKPKFHYLVHYPRCLLEYGPLIHCWTLRFEAKHFYFKEIAWRTKNRKNILKTLAERHQYHQAWCMSKSQPDKFLTQEVIDHTCGELKHTNELSRDVQRLILPLARQADVYMVKNVACSGTWYHSGSAVILEKLENGYHFGIIQMSFIIAGLVHILCKTVQTTDYVHHVHAYAISADHGQLKLLKVTELADHYPLGIYKTDFSKLIVLKHRLL